MLLVDDEPRVLAGLQRVLRTLPVELSCFGTGEEALSWMEGRKDVLVVMADFSLGAGMNGLCLLQEVATHHPHVRRVLHTGEITFEANLTPNTELTILVKPCDTGLLLKVLRPIVLAQGLPEPY